MINLSIEKLSSWIQDLKNLAMKDESFLVYWYPETEDKPYSLVGGWSDVGFEEKDRKTVCTSKQSPAYGMSIKVIKNEGPYAYADFDTLEMPYDEETNEVYDTCTTLEWDDCPKLVAKFYKEQWEKVYTIWSAKDSVEE